MPYQTDLPQAGRLLAHPRGERGQAARFVALILLLVLLPWFPSPAQANCQASITRVLVAPERAGDGVRPLEGWQPVTLPDLWQRHWPGFLGPVWYRLDWQADCPAEPLALNISRMVMAGEVWLNDDLIWRDESLVEPLSRSWNLPRYWLLPVSSQREANTLWIRLVGSEHAAPGLGTVRLGGSEQVWPEYRQQLLEQREIIFVSLLISLVLGVLFLTFWLIRRQERTFGWFALASLLWSVGLGNMLVTTAWPFTNGEVWDRLSQGALALYCPVFCMFIWSFGGMRFARLGRVVWAGAILFTVAAVLVPQMYIGQLQLISAFALRLVLFVVAMQLLWHAHRVQEARLMLFGVFMSALSIYEFLAFMGWLDVTGVYAALSAPALSMVMFLVLATRFASSLRRIERFNDELQATVDSTRAELIQTLQREHQLEADNIRLNERLRLTHDLHDGLGSSLMRSITRIEHGEGLKDAQFLSVLKTLRSDLRDVIDGSSVVPAWQSPQEWLAPVRRRFIDLFDDLGIESHWNLPEHWPGRFTPPQLLALTRFLEEALTNVLKHAGATRLDVGVRAEAENGLSLWIRDDGRGFEVDAVLAAGTGVGMSSMRMRIERMGGRLRIESRPGETLLTATLQGEREGSRIPEGVPLNRSAADGRSGS
ncbi:sensor histidine kinase [Pseudomonas lopnurensis]|uniref:sensor histidine kinase n=1 Tax=Pseudomonas lopnurensis TaxID=1477517 RepID=UPI001879EA16|nr:ATP-binding protein [Pseudomonas lopnurensis]MBE7374938.1 histidine kinase [Pseudomonas lopnurensis]